MTIFLTVLLILLLLLCLPLKIAVKIREEVTITLGYLFFRKQIVPPKVKEAEEKEEEEPEGEKKPTKAVKKEKEKYDLEFLKSAVEIAAELLGKCVKAVRKFVGRTTFAKIQLDILVARGDAAQTAVAFGEMNAYVYGGVAALRNFLRLKVERIRIVPGFTQESDRYEGEVEIRILPIALLAMGLNILANALAAGVKFLLLTRRRQNRKDQQPPNEGREQHGEQTSNQ